MQIIFTHIPKAAGTTFRNVLINNFSHRHMDWSTGQNKIAAARHHFPFCSGKEMNKLSSISGHWIRCTNEMKKSFPDAKFITFVRDPIDRLISLYKHIIVTWDPKLKFDEWVADGSRPEISNFQTRFIAGKCDIDRAIEILEKEYFFVGKAELFDESMCVLSEMLDNNIDTHYQSLRVSKKKDILIKNNPNYKRAIERLYDHNKFDVILNDFVSNELIKTYRSKYSSVTDEIISAFKEENLEFSFSKMNKGAFLLKKHLYYRPLSYIVNR